MFSHREFRRPMAVAVMLLTGLVLSSASEAEARGRAKAKAITNAELITQLEIVNATLRPANHNYKRHRVHAMEEINRALSALGVKKLNTDYGEKAKPETPATSNAQLDKARTDLRGLVVRIGKPKAKTPRGR